MGKELFQVRFDKAERTYTLIKEGISLTEEQAEQISTAYLLNKEQIVLGRQEDKK